MDWFHDWTPGKNGCKGVEGLKLQLLDEKTIRFFARFRQHHPGETPRPQSQGVLKRKKACESRPSSLKRGDATGYFYCRCV
ncbi:hypothetical protein [Blastopirellula marina]|uniref:hypothetical protein n=1 Tax=Blastopirellula marina TaxID=124 RepID=UPI000322F53C|nr:hypothetical protein [Blastopirellula marina]